jgi:hypothetical protein
VSEKDFDWDLPLAVDYAEFSTAQRREWLERVFGQIARETGSVGRDVIVFDIPWSHRVFRPRGGSLTTELRVLNDDRCLVTGRGRVNDIDVDIWRRASASAADALGLTNTFAFTAIVGVAPGPNRYPGRTLRLAQPSTLAGLRMEPISTRIADTWRPTGLDHAGTIVESWPILVEGNVTSFHPAEGARLAGVELRLLCSLLSVLCRTPFAVG